MTSPPLVHTVQGRVSRHHQENRAKDQELVLLPSGGQTPAVRSVSLEVRCGRCAREQALRSSAPVCRRDSVPLDRGDLEAAGLTPSLNGARGGILSPSHWPAGVFSVLASGLG